MLQWLKVSLLQSNSNSLTDLLWLTPGETDSAGSGANVWQNSNLKLTSPRFTSVWWTPPGAASGLQFLKNLNESSSVWLSDLDVSVCPGSGSGGPSCCSVMFRFVPGCFLQIHSLVQSVLVLLSCLLMANHCHLAGGRVQMRPGPVLCAVRWLSACICV